MRLKKEKKSGVVFTAYVIVYIITTMCDGVLLYILSVLFLLFFWCPCMAISVSVQYNCGLLLDIILSTQCYFHRRTRLNTTRSFLFAAFIPPKRFDVFSPLTGGCSEGLGALKYMVSTLYRLYISFSVLKFGRLVGGFIFGDSIF